MQGTIKMDEKDLSEDNASLSFRLLEARRLELRFLRRVASDLRSYRKMIGVKNYD